MVKRIDSEEIDDNESRNTTALKRDIEVFPEIMTEDELIIYLRIPLVSKAKDYHNVIDNLKRFRDLPCIHISSKCLYPLEAVRKWTMDQIEEGNK